MVDFCSEAGCDIHKLQETKLNATRLVERQRLSAMEVKLTEGVRPQSKAITAV